MSLAANRPLNWNVLQVNSRSGEITANKLSASDYAAERGARVLALTIPTRSAPRISFRTGFLLDVLNGGPSRWRCRTTRSSPSRRSRPPPRAERHGPADRGAVFAASRTGRCSRVRGVHPRPRAVRRSRGRRDRGRPKARSPGTSCATSPSPTTCARSSLRPTAARRRELEAASRVWRDPRAIVGASDAGAHLDFLATFNYCTRCSPKPCASGGCSPTEEAVSLLTTAQARLYGLTGRGRLAEGWCADIVVFDESTIGPGPVVTREDLPGGAPRLYGEAEGIEHVLVNGVEIVRGGDFTDRGRGVSCGQAATPRRSRCRAADHDLARTARELRFDATVRLTHTLPHRNGDGTTRDPPSRGGSCAPEAISGYRPDGDGQSAREEPTSEIRTGFSRQSRDPVSAPRGRGDLRSRSSARLHSSGWATGHLLGVWTGASCHVAVRRSTHFSGQTA